MKKMSLFSQLLIFSSAFTILMWTGAWAFSALAGQSTKSTLKQIEQRLNTGELTEESRQLDFAGIENVLVETNRSDVLVSSTGDARAKIEFLGRAERGVKPLNIERQGNSLVIKVDIKKGGMTWNFGDSEDNSKSTKFNGLRVSLPDKIAKNVRVATTTGDVTVKRLGASRIEVSTTTGDIEMEDSEGDIKASSTTGDIEVERAKADHMEFSATTGDVEIKDPISKQILSSTTTGDVSVRLADGAGWKFSLNTNHGDVKNDWVDSPTAERMIRLNTTSGDITVRKQ